MKEKELLKRRRGIFKLLGSPGIEFKDSIRPAYVAGGPERQPYSYSVPSPHGCSKIPAQGSRRRAEKRNKKKRRKDRQDG